MTDDQATYLDGVTRFVEADDIDPVQLLWRLQNEARIGRLEKTQT